MSPRKSPKEELNTTASTASFGLLLALLGLALLIGSVVISTAGALTYFAWLGLMMLICGGLFFKGKKLGVQLFVLTFVVMVIWNVYELGFDWHALVPRLGMGLVILVHVLTAKKFKNLS